LEEVVILESVPSEFIAGDTWRWTRDFADYPAGTWTVTYYFENAAQTFNVAGVADGTSHDFTIAAATTADYKAGRYFWSARATDGSVVETITDENGWLEVKTDPAAAGTRDRRSWARRVLDALEATLEGRASTDQMSMSLAGRSISRMSPSELMDWRDRMRAEVRTQEQGDKAGLGRDIRVRYGRA